MNDRAPTLDVLFETLERILAAAVEFLPTLASGVLVLAAGVLLAWGLKLLVMQTSEALVNLFGRLVGGRAAARVRALRPILTLAANALFWLMVVVFVAVSSRVLGLGAIADSITELARFLPSILAAVAILLGGYVLASLASDAVSRMRLAESTNAASAALARLCFFLVNVIAALAALRQLGIDLVLVRTLVVILASAACGAAALAFGLGSKSSLDNIIASHYLKRVYKRGQRIHIDGLDGEILEIGPTAVVLDTATGRAAVPASRFNRSTSVLVGQEAGRDAE
ncbi:MAG: mechanosensitive ion channel family protein [Gammaproteobacteria bacterium]